MSRKHTEGTWTPGRTDIRSYDAVTGEPCAYVYRPRDDERTRICVRGENCEADARLIASAPDLLAELQSCEALLSLLRYRCERTVPWGTPGIPDQRRVDAALAKAQKALAAVPTKAGTPTTKEE